MTSAEGSGMHPDALIALFSSLAAAARAYCLWKRAEARRQRRRTA